MIYEMDEQITIRSLRPEDAQVIAREEVAQGWVNASPKKYEQRLRDQQEGKAIALAAEYCGQVAGYINVYLAPEQGAFAGQGIPEIVDFGVLAKYRNRGIGSRLMDAARADCGGACRHRLSGGWTAQRVWQRAADVHQARVYPGRKRRLVPGRGLRALCRLPQR